MSVYYKGGHRTPFWKKEKWDLSFIQDALHWVIKPKLQFSVRKSYNILCSSRRHANRPERTLSDYQLFFYNLIRALFVLGGVVARVRVCRRTFLNFKHFHWWIFVFYNKYYTFVSGTWWYTCNVRRILLLALPPIGDIWYFSSCDPSAVVLFTRSFRIYIFQQNNVRLSLILKTYTWNSTRIARRIRLNKIHEKNPAS